MSRHSGSFDGAGHCPARVLLPYKNLTDPYKNLTDRLPRLYVGRGLLEVFGEPSRWDIHFLFRSRGLREP
jgi:hypothetical protein